MNSDTLRSAELPEAASGAGPAVGASAAAPPDTGLAGTPNWALLALMRFALAFVVMGEHVGLELSQAWLAWPCTHLNAGHCVRAFFLISGFSIAHSIHRRPRGFYWRRVERIYPTYLLALGLGLLFYPLFGQSLPAWKFIVVHFLMLQTLVLPVIGSLVPAWSLSVECLYYVLAPWFKRLPERIVIGLSAASTLLFFTRDALGLPQWIEAPGLWTPAGLLWAWLAGWLIYTGSDKVRRAVAYQVVFLVAMSTVGAGRLSVIPELATLLLLFNSHRFTLKQSARRVANYLGEISYPMYLMHFPTLMVLVKLRITDGAVVLPIILAVTVVTYHVAEGITWLVRGLWRRSGAATQTH